MSLSEVQKPSEPATRFAENIWNHEVSQKMLTEYHQLPNVLTCEFWNSIPDDIFGQNFLNLFICCKNNQIFLHETKFSVPKVTDFHRKFSVSKRGSQKEKYFLHPWSATHPITHTPHTNSVRVESSCARQAGSLKQPILFFVFLGVWDIFC